MKRTPARPAFTISELLVVVAIIAILVAVGTPAILSSLRSINRSLADTQLRVAIAGARDAAIRNAGRGDAMAVFTFEPGGSTRVFVCTAAGVIDDFTVPKTGDPVAREVFVPDATTEPITIPAGWSVRAYVPAFVLGNDGNAATDQAWYEETHGSSDDFDRGNWIFPETAFFDPTAGDQGDSRQSFAIRFKSGTGEIATDRNQEALILLPAEPTRDAAGALDDFRDGDPFDDFNALDALDLRRFVVRVLNAPDDVLNADEKRLLLGNESSDTVLVRPVTQVALYRESELAGAIGARLDRTTQSLYASGTTQPELVDNADAKAINDWLVGRPAESAGPEDDDAERASRVFTLQIIAGNLRELAQ